MNGKRKWLISGVLSLLVGGGIFAYSHSHYKVSLEQAQRIALEYAGVSKQDVTFTRTEKELDDWKKIYEIEFFTQDGEYDFTIDGQTGSVLEREIERFTPAVSSSANYSSSILKSGTQAAAARQATSPSQAGEVLAENKVKTIVLEHAGLAETVSSDWEIQLKPEAGNWVYEVDFKDRAAGFDYDYELDAVSGVILQHSKENLVDSDEAKN